MRADTLIPSAPAVERLVASRVARGDSPHTVRALRGDLDELCGFLGAGMTPETCSSEQLRRWQAQLAARRLATATVAAVCRRLARCSATSRAGASARTTRRSCSSARAGAGGRPTPSPPRTAPSCSTATRTTTCAACAIARCLELLYGCGLRAAEVCALQLSAYDPVAGRLRVIGKGDRERVVPVGEPARAALAEWLRSGLTASGGGIGRAPPERPGTPALRPRTCAGRSSGVPAWPA